MDLNKLARVGDVIETAVRNPAPGMLRLRLDTPEACAAGNDLLMNKNSGWQLTKAAEKA